MTEVLVGRPGDVIVPDAFEDRIQHNALKTMVVPDGPVTLFAKREEWHDRSRQMNVARNRIVGRRLQEVEIVLHLVLAPTSSSFVAVEQM